MQRSRAGMKTLPPLKPCPFCGEALVEKSDHHGNWYGHRDEVGECWASIAQIHDEVNAKRWNARSEQPLPAPTYIRAGYSENGADAGACRLLRNVRIAAEVARIDAEYARAAGITALDCWKRWKIMAFTDITEFLKPGGGVKPPSEWPAGTAAAVKMYDPGGPQSSEKIRLYDQLKALQWAIERLQPVTPAATTTVTQNVQANVDRLMLTLRAPLRAE